MKKILLLVVVFVVCALGLFMICEQTASSDKETAGEVILPTNMPQIAEAAALQPGESAEIEVTPELREYYFGLARTRAWFYLPEFDEGEPPTDPPEYWLLIELADVIGWDEHGYYVYAEESPWRTVDENTPEGYGTSGMPIVSVAEMDEWVGSHFAGAQVEHGFYDYHKGYDFDGETYYGVVDCSFPRSYYELGALSAENVDGQIVYTATLYDDYLNEYGFFYPDDSLTEEENRAALAEMMANASPAEIAIYENYGEQLLSGEIHMDEAIRQTIINGDTKDFPHSTRLEVKYYLNEQTGEPVILQVHWYSETE